MRSPQSEESTGVGNKKLSNEELILAAKELNLGFEELQAWLCLNCQECCKWISVQTNLKDVAGMKHFVDFYVTTRQITMTKVKNRGVFLSVPHTCPHLMSGIGCDIYDHRPASCRLYDGRVDFLMKDVCKWNLLDEILKEEEDGTEGAAGQD